ncbi:MAG: glycosyltransferase family 4 protein [Phycisphaeraceae bacterium]|nr:glycosyltransferase family 4 protein [Phycisphaeraceae bacterium]
MRILSITHMLGPGGLERAVQNCALEYRRRGHESAVLSYEAGGVRAEAIRAGGVEVFLPDPDLESALERARAWRPDVVHAHRIGIAQPVWDRVLGALRTGSERLPVVETNHFARVDYSPGRLAIDVHMHLSRWCLWKWRGWSRWQRPAPVGVVVPHIVDEGSFYPETGEERLAFRREHGLPEGAIVFGRVGQADPGKWLPAIFGAFAAVAEQNPEAWLLLVGLPAVLRPDLERLPAGARARVVTIDPLRGDDLLRRCYSAMDVFVHASMLGESFGFVLCESMLCGTPVVTLSRPLKDNSQLEVVGHLRGGLVVCDEVSMAEAMRRLASDPALRTRLGEGGRRWVMEQYSRGRVGDELERVLAATVGAGGDRRRLGEALADLSPRVSTGSIRELASECIGRPSWRERLMLPIVSNPVVYRAWSGIKFRGRSSRRRDGRRVQ